MTAQLSTPLASESLPVTPSPSSPLNRTDSPTNNGAAGGREGAGQEVKVQVGIAHPSLAQNDLLVNQLVDLINAVYTVAEEGIFNADYRRITPDDLRNLVRDSELALAWITESTSTSSSYDAPNSKIIGTARVQSLSPTHGVFGMLVVDPSSRNTGAGKKLVHFSEQHCREKLGKTKMQCELLVSTEFEHPFKVRMHSWYERMGYRVVKEGDFAGEYPHLGKCLVTKVEFRVYEKGLV